MQFVKTSNENPEQYYDSQDNALQLRTTNAIGTNDAITY